MAYPTARLFYCKSDPKIFNKVYTQVGTDIAITYNSDISVTDPVFRFSKDISSLNFNYIFVPELDGRNYWVKKAPFYRNGYWEVECHVDVIETWKNQIKKIGGVLKRAGYNDSHQYINQYLNDEKFKAYQAPCIRTIGFEPETSNAFLEDRTEFIMCVVGNNTTPDPEPEPDPNEPVQPNEQEGGIS